MKAEGKLGKIGIPAETSPGENRVAATPDSIKRLIKLGFEVGVQTGAGIHAGFGDSEYQAAGAQLCGKKEIWDNDIILKINRPSSEEVPNLKSGSLLISLLQPYSNDGFLETLAKAGVNSIALEWIPRTSRAQSMDVLSSQANIAGYRAVLEAAAQYGRFVPLMMTSAGSAKAAKVTVLGAGVAGLQAIATARRLGANIEAYDVRPEVKEQIQSLGAKFIEIQLDEQGSGSGGYARELGEESKKKLQAALDDKIAKSDIVITTANIPGKRAPVLVTETVVRKMRRGSVIVDMAAATGGNCPLTQQEKVIDVDGVKIVGYTNYPSLMASDASNFFARNLVSILGLMVSNPSEGKPNFVIDLKDDILDASVLTFQGDVRRRKG